MQKFLGHHAALIAIFEHKRKQTTLHHLNFDINGMLHFPHGGLQIISQRCKRQKVIDAESTGFTCQFSLRNTCRTLEVRGAIQSISGGMRLR
jgi:hypothetical protein